MAVKRQALGRWGEQLAAEYLEAQGYAVLARNVRTGYGEIDLVARQDGVAAVTVFAEVKTRRSGTFGLPEQSVTAAKQAHMAAAAQAYMLSHPELTGEWRLDVIAIRGAPGQANPEIIHFENAITGAN